jgi:hypothetical protein
VLLDLPYAPQDGSYDIGARLGHFTIKITADVYTHTSAGADREAAIAVERAIHGDLFPAVPNIENRNSSAALNWANEVLRRGS